MKTNSDNSYVIELLRTREYVIGAIVKILESYVSRAKEEFNKL